VRGSVVGGVNSVEVGRLPILVCLGEGDDSSINGSTLDDILGEKSGVAEDRESITGPKDGEVRTGGYDGGVKRCGQFICPRGVSDGTVRDNEIGLGETLLYPTLDVLSALIGVPPVPRDRGDTALEEVALVETEVRNVDESARSVGASFSEGLRACLDENTRTRLNKCDRVLVDANDFGERPVVLIRLSVLGGDSVRVRVGLLERGSAFCCPVGSGVDSLDVVLVDRVRDDVVCGRGRSRSRRTENGRVCGRRHILCVDV